MAKSSIVARRNILRAEIKQRQSEVLPRLKKAVEKAKKDKTKRIQQCKIDCKTRKRQVKERAEKARKQLAAHIKRAKAKAQSACKSCTVTMTETSLDQLEYALTELGKESKNIKDMRTKADAMKSERGRAGGLKAAEKRAESDDRVIFNLADDQDLITLFKKIRRKIKATKGRTRTEAFFEYVHDHPSELDELRAKKQIEYEKEAEKEFLERSEIEALELDLSQCQREIRRLRKAEELALKEIPF